MSKNESIENTEPITTYVDVKTLAALERKAAENEHTLSALLRLLIKRYVTGNLEFRKTDDE